MAETTKNIGWWERARSWLSKLHIRIVTIDDTPHSIALGLAVGIFFGFTPLWSLKTLLSIAVAWLLRSNKIAAAVSVQLHDLILPFMPAIYFWEYKIGFWILFRRLPQHARLWRFTLRGYMNWHVLFTVGRPLLVGSIVIGLPSAALVYLLCRALVVRSRES